jgi:hypothetical protein
MIGTHVAGASAGIVLLLGIGCAAARAVETVETPKVLPDRAIDASSLEGIVAGVCKPGMKPHEKFLALYEFYRRMVYHGRYMGPDRRSVLRMINSYGVQLCGSQAAAFSVLCRKAGFETRVAHVKAKGYGGHTVMEARYDGAWHLVDTMTAFYVLNRKGQVAGLAELKADPALIRDAVREKRVPPEWCLCTREIEKEQAGIEELMPKDRPWSLLRWGEGKTLPDFWEQAVTNGRTQEGLYGGHVQAGEMDIVLKPNEEYVRLWDGLGLWLKPASFEKVPPYHTCGHIDELDAPNFRYFEPYRKTGFKYARYAYRYYGNGWLEWAPDGTRGEVKAASKATDLAHDAAAGLFEAAGGKLVGELVVPVKSPYAVVKIEIDLRLRQDERTLTIVSVGGATTRNGRRRARYKEVWRKDGAADGVEKIVVDCTGDRRAKYDYDIKVQTRAGTAAFNLARVKTVFQLNPASLPSLYPGENTVTVSAKTAGDLKANRLLVTYDWADGDGWKQDRTDTQTVARIPYTYTLTADVPKDKMPRMRRLVMKLVPR